MLERIDHDLMGMKKNAFHVDTIDENRHIFARTIDAIQAHLTYSPEFDAAARIIDFERPFHRLAATRVRSCLDPAACHLQAGRAPSL